MRVDLRAGKEAVFAQYDFFRVDSAKENYRLHLEGYHGTAGKCGPERGGGGHEGDPHHTFPCPIR